MAVIVIDAPGISGVRTVVDRCISSMVTSLTDFPPQTWMSASGTHVEGMRFAQTRKAATSAPVNKASPEIPSLPARTLTNARPTQMFAERTRSVRTPTPDSVANVRQGSVGTQTQRVRQPKFAPFANQTLTAPTMPSVRTENACVDRASRLLARSA